jgi:peptidoglycan/xylan/chitin deacetylase (PgdA/CDA1 family)
MKSLLRRTAKDVLQTLVYPGRFLWRLPSRSGAVALTFDDGPDPQWTPPMLDLLAAMGTKATFFLVGRAVERHPELVRRIVAEGHAVGGHSFGHTVITRQDPAGLAEDLMRCRRTIAEACGVDTVLFRPPKGEVDWASIRVVCRAGYRLVHWSRTYSDYRRDGTAALLGRIQAAGAASGDILLFHDNNAFTLGALEAALPRWRGQPLRFERLSESLDRA